MIGALARRRGVCAGLMLLLAGCGGSEPEPVAFTPLSYSYLTPLRLNVGSVEVDDSWAPRPDGLDVSAQSPVRPIDGLRAMGQDRLVAAGNAGRAVMHVEDASILRNGDQLDGHLAVTLDIYTAGGTRTAYAEARVARATTEIPDGPDGLRQALYKLTRRMVDDMNVELEYQMRRSLKDWLLESPTAGSTAVPAPVSQQPLTDPQPLAQQPLAQQPPAQQPQSPPQALPAAPPMGELPSQLGQPTGIYPSDAPPPEMPNPDAPTPLAPD
jgi:hypothetical protein